MRITLRASVVAACAAALVAAPTALSLDTVIRVEGSAGNLVPESPIPIEGTGTATVFDSNFAQVDVSRASAFWQLYRATAATGLGLGFTYFPSFNAVLVDKVGPDANAGSAGWQYTVDHVAPSVGASDYALKQGDTVLWYYGGADGARELDVTPSADRVPAGTSFTVHVTSYAADGTAAPGQGAAVRYGGAVATADAAGNATFIAQGAGTGTVLATRAGDVRSAARAVCAYGADPTVCNLPAAPSAPAGGGTTAGLADTVAPGSRVVFPRLGGRAAVVLAVSGVAGPDRSDVAKVEVALARRSGTLCRFRARSGGLTAPRPCAQRLWVPARSAGDNWSLPTGRRGLAPGLWRVWTRATDGAGNVESRGLARVNSGTFTVLGRARRR